VLSKCQRSLKKTAKNFIVEAAGQKQISSTFKLIVQSQQSNSNPPGRAKSFLQKWLLGGQSWGQGEMQNRSEKPQSM